MNTVYRITKLIVPPEQRQEAIERIRKFVHKHPAAVGASLGVGTGALILRKLHKKLGRQTRRSNNV